MAGRAGRLAVLGFAAALLASATALLPPVAARVLVAGATATDEAPSVYVDPAHDSRQASDPLTPGLARKWSQHFDNWVSYPVVDGGVAYFTVAGPASGSTAPGTRLYAVTAATGAPVWGPVSISYSMAKSALMTFAALAYDGGHVYLMGGDMVLRAYDAAGGSPLWTDTLGDPTGANGDVFPGIPTATGGIVYVITGYTTGTLHAIDGNTGAQRWSAARGNGESASAVAVSGGVVYDAGPAYPGYAYDAGTGAPLWSGGRAGGAVTTQVYDGKVFARGPDTAVAGSGEILNSSDGSAVRSYRAPRRRRSTAPRCSRCG
jgi:outer membrane protein assembly factor BamB